MLRRRLLRLLAVNAAAGCALAGERAPAPDFQLRDARGVRRRLSDYRSNVVVLNFWATWCAPCRAEIPLLMRVHRTYEARGLRVVGVAMDEQGWAAVTPFLAQHRVDCPVLLGNPAVARRYGGLKTLPQTWFLDRAGRVVASHKAMIEEERLIAVVETLLAERTEPETASGARRTQAR